MDSGGADFPALTILVPTVAALDGPTLEREFTTFQESLFYSLGIICPLVRLEEDARLPAYTFQLQINDQRLPPIAGLQPDELWVNAPVSELSAPGQTCRAAVDPTSQAEAAIVRGDEDAARKWREKGHEVRGAAQYALLHLAAAIRQQPSALPRCCPGRRPPRRRGARCSPRSRRAPPRGTRE